MCTFLWCIKRYENGWQILHMLPQQKKRNTRQCTLNTQFLLPSSPVKYWFDKRRSTQKKKEMKNILIWVGIYYEDLDAFNEWHPLSVCTKACRRTYTCANNIHTYIIKFELVCFSKINTQKWTWKIHVVVVCVNIFFLLCTTVWVCYFLNVWADQIENKMGLVCSWKYFWEFLGILCCSFEVFKCL